MSDSSSSDDEGTEQLQNRLLKKVLKKKKTDDAVDPEEKSIEEVDEEEEEETKTFKELGVCDPLSEACERLGWKTPSKIQMKALPAAIEGRDIIGLAETGSGKTGAFAIPIIQSLLENPQKLYALVLTPTRELAFQIAQQFEALGAGVGLLVAVIVGGIDMTTQAIALAKRPHIIVATPGRLVDHLENTKGFNMRALKYLVMDEADRILNMDFEVELDKIIKVIPKDRRTYLFSATMTKKEAYLVYLLNELAGKSSIIFCATCISATHVAILLRQLGMQSIPLHGQMGQEKRLGSLNKFKSKARNILVCTDVASRGLDIPHVDVVFNYDVPNQSKDYVHRVGRTARAGRSGVAVTFVTQYDVEAYQRIEQHIGKKLTEYPCAENKVMMMVERTQEASEAAKVEVKEMEDKKKERNGY